MFAIIDRVGWHVEVNLRYTYNIFILAYLSFRTTLFSSTQGWRTLFGVISAQIYFTGWQAMPLITFLAVSSGVLVTLQAIMQMTYIGGVSYVGKYMIMVVVREIGPLLTALIVVARSGIAVASEIASMKVNKEINALEAMGINPLSYVIFPRLMGGVVSVLCLAFYFSIFAIGAGYVICLFTKGLPLKLYLGTIAQAVQLSDFFLFITKNTVNGLIIFSVCCHEGLQVEKSPHEIPQVTTKAVVKSTVYILAFNVLVTMYYYFEYLSGFGVF